jgi:hypothetical protein
VKETRSDQSERRIREAERFLTFITLTRIWWPTVLSAGSSRHHVLFITKSSEIEVTLLQPELRPAIYSFNAQCFYVFP